MPTPADALDSSIAFPSAISYDLIVIFAVIALLAVIMNALVLLANRGRVATPNSLLLLSLCFSDLIHGSSIVTLSSGSIALRAYFWGKNVCLLNSLIYVACCCISSLTITCIAIERYLSICNGITISFHTAKIMIALIWVVSLGGNLVLVLHAKAGQLVVLSDSAWYCNPDWTSKISPWYELIILLIIFVAIITVTLPFSYYNIYKKVKRVANESRKKSIYEIERLAFIRSICVTTVYFSCWSPEIWGILYEFTSEQLISVELHMSASLLIITHACINPILLIALDHQIKRGVYDFLHIKAISTNEKLELKMTSNSSNSKTIVEPREIT